MGPDPDPGGPKTYGSGGSGFRIRNTAGRRGKTLATPPPWNICCTPTFLERVIKKSTCLFVTWVTNKKWQWWGRRGELCAAFYWRQSSLHRRNDSDEQVLLYDDRYRDDKKKFNTRSRVSFFPTPDCLAPDSGIFIYLLLTTYRLDTWLQYFALGTSSEIYYRNKNNYFDRQSLTTSTLTQYTYSFNEDLMTSKSLVSKCKYFQKQLLCHQKSLNFPAV